MEYVPGATLSQKLAEGPLSEPEVISLGIQLAEALEVAHAKVWCAGTSSRATS
jgi:hypothetical protein